MHLTRLENQLATANYLGGRPPNILDFSTYHCLWFLHSNEALRDDFSPFTHVLAWISRMANFGNGTIKEISGPKAIEIAQSTHVTAQEKWPGIDAEGLAYGFQPTKGKLLTASLEELTIARTDPVAGDFAVHFPRLGFRINKL